MLTGGVNATAQGDAEHSKRETDAETLDSVSTLSQTSQVSLNKLAYFFPSICFFSCAVASLPYGVSLRLKYTPVFSEPLWGSRDWVSKSERPGFKISLSHLWTLIVRGASYTLTPSVLIGKPPCKVRMTTTVLGWGNWAYERPGQLPKVPLRVIGSEFQTVWLKSP